MLRLFLSAFLIVLTSGEFGQAVMCSQVLEKASSEALVNTYDLLDPKTFNTLSEEAYLEKIKALLNPILGKHSRGIIYTKSKEDSRRLLDFLKQAFTNVDFDLYKFDTTPEEGFQFFDRYDNSPSHFVIAESESGLQTKMRDHTAFVFLDPGPTEGFSLRLLEDLESIGRDTEPLQILMVTSTQNAEIKYYAATTTPISQTEPQQEQFTTHDIVKPKSRKGTRGSQKVKKTTKKEFLPPLEAREIVIQQGFKNITEFRAWKERPSNVPSDPWRVYKHHPDYESTEHFLGYAKSRNDYKSLDKAIELVKSLKFKSLKSYNDWLKSDDRPEDIPENPTRFYGNQFIISDYLDNKPKSEPAPLKPKPAPVDDAGFEALRRLMQSAENPG